MIRLIRWLIGYVEFSFTGGFCEGFINECFSRGCNISEVYYNGDILCASCPAELYPSLRRIARAHGGKTGIIKKRGIIFKLLPFRNRWGLFLGALFAVIIICTLSGFVWDVEVTGTENISKAEVIRLLNDNGLKEGVWKESVDKGRLESLVMAAFPDCGWAHINERGTTMRLEISEAVRKPETVNKRAYSNLKAKKDGIIVKASVYNGWAKRKKGDAVVKGDILISGVTVSKKKNRFAHARGEYIARVKEPVNIKVSRLQKIKQCQSVSRYKYLYFFGLKLPLFLVRTSDGEESEDVSFVRLNGCRLPLGIITKTVKEYRLKTVNLSDKELQALAQKQLKKCISSELEGCEIINRKINTVYYEDSVVIDGYILCLENIGEEVKIIK